MAMRELLNRSCLRFNALLMTVQAMMGLVRRWVAARTRPVIHVPKAIADVDYVDVKWEREEGGISVRKM